MGCHHQLLLILNLLVLVVIFQNKLCVTPHKDNNDFSGRIPSEIGRLSNLTGLALSKTKTSFLLIVLPLEISMLSFFEFFRNQMF